MKTTCGKIARQRNRTAFLNGKLQVIREVKGGAVPAAAQKEDAPQVAASSAAIVPVAESKDASFDDIGDQGQPKEGGSTDTRQALLEEVAHVLERDPEDIQTNVPLASVSGGWLLACALEI